MSILIREKSQFQTKHLGLLEKHKDYKLRAKDKTIYSYKVLSINLG